MSDSYTEDQVNAAIDSAITAITEAADLTGDDRVADAMNLVINTAMWSLRNPHRQVDLDEVITENYDGHAPADVLSWIR